MVPSMVKYYGNDKVGQQITDPLHTITSKDREGLIAANLSKFYGGVTGSSAGSPLSTTTAVDHNALQTAHIAEFKGQDKGQHPEQPLRTITASADEFGTVRTTIQQYEAEKEIGRWPLVRDMLNS